MKILVLCTYFPPDTGVPAKRPYYLAKYLSEFGHNVTVIRSGKITTMPDDSFYDFSKFKVISYYGENSDAELYAKKKKTYNLKNWRKYGFLPNGIRDVLKTISNKYDKIFGYSKWVKSAKTEYFLIKNVIDMISDQKYDIVFSTYTNISNAFGAIYAKKVFGCKWVMDFRDIVSDEGKNSKIDFERKKYDIEDNIIKSADHITTCSSGLAKTFKEHCNEDKYSVIYNGYDDAKVAKNSDININNSCLNFCYTGTMYKWEVKALSILPKVLYNLYKKKLININNIKFYYAGPSDCGAFKVFKKNGLMNSYIDLGYLNKNDVMFLQNNSDVYITLHYAKKYYNGMITGKFSEGIQAKKNILSFVIGDICDSEIYILNKKYNFGYVFENIRFNEMYEELEKYIVSLYNEKVSKGTINYIPKKDLMFDFHYKNISRKLEKKFLEILKA